MLVNAQLRRIAILDGNRIPLARSNTAYAITLNQQMLTAALQDLIGRFNLYSQRLDRVAVGAVIKHARNFNLTREAVLSTTLAKQTPAYDVQQACGTGLEAAALVANKVAPEQIGASVVGGTNTASDAPVGLSEKMRRILLETNRAKSTGAHVEALVGLRPSVFVRPLLPHNSEPRTGLPMGEHCELMVKHWGIRREDQDALALRSHHNLAAAYGRGFFTDLMAAHLGLNRDNNLHGNLTIEQLAKLQPVFDRSAASTTTAGNPTPLTSGASCVLLANEDWARAHNLPVLAYMACVDTTAVNFFSSTPERNKGLLITPTYAVSRMLRRAGLALQDLDYYETHETFTAQVLSTPAVWESPEYCRRKLGRSAPMDSIDRSKLNADGSSLGTDHLLAATGRRIVATLAKMLAQRGSRRGLVSVCAAGDQGIVAILERPGAVSH